MTPPLNDIDGKRLGTAHLTESDRYQLLSAERRRIALEVLADWTRPVHLEELATAVAARESDSESPDQSAVERVAITLHHNHLPRMTDTDVLEYDTESRRVR